MCFRLVLGADCPLPGCADVVFEHWQELEQLPLFFCFLTDCERFVPELGQRGVDRGFGFAEQQPELARVYADAVGKPEDATHE